MRLEIEISEKEYSILSNALEDYKDSMLDGAEHRKDRPDEADSWNLNAKIAEDLAQRIHDKVIDITYEEARAKFQNQEKLVIDALIKWAKSSMIEPTFELEDLMDAYFEIGHANNGANQETIIENREMLYDKLVIGCIYACNHEELHKLDNIKSRITSIR